MDNKSIRVNINVSSNVKRWFENRSNETGISQSGLMAMALNEYIDQKESLKAMGDMGQYFSKFDKLIEEMQKKK